jgi:alkylation response protein AidB-like acyl-CoA dehydrogenase
VGAPVVVKAEAIPKIGERESLTERVRPHLAALATRAGVTEAARMVSAENIELIREAGFMRALLPAALGGDERGLWDYCQGVRTVVKACPSTGWVTGVLNVHPAALCHFGPSIQRQVLATGIDTIICSSGTPAMKAKLADGGILVSGLGRWASGCDHAEWALIGVKVPDPSDAQFPERRYRDYMFMAHKSEYVIEDTWYSTGQRGSGSKDLIFKNLFVSNDRLERLDAVYLNYSHGAGTVDSWIAHIPFPLLFACFLPAIALGCADGMIAEFTKRQRVRKNAYTGAQGILNPAGYMRLAESVHEIESLTAYYEQLMNSMQSHGERRERLTEAKALQMQSTLPFITTRAVQVIERLFEAAGSSAIADFNPMQRYWRDGHTARLHTGSDYDTALQHHGRFMLGLMPTPDL